MAYRITEEFNPEDYLPRFYVRNGATVKMAFDCYYWTPLLRPEHYHRDPHHEPVPWSSFDPVYGKVNPRFPDMSRPEDFTEIDLSAEGYTNASVIYDDTTISSNLTTTTTFDDNEANVVNCKVKANLPKFQDDAKETKFTVFVTGSSGLQDVVCRGILVILPGPPYSS